jgi:tRNA uridine 5-carbamoylmethylation protein Kti12
VIVECSYYSQHALLNKQQGVISMTLTKLRNKTVITDDDLGYNQRIGMPIEVFCLEKKQTIAFGKIQSFTNGQICINGNHYSRDQYVLFGFPAQLL